MKSLAEVLDRVARDHPVAQPPEQAAAQAAADPSVCPICHGAGYVVYDVPVGHPDFGRPQPCRCTLQIQASDHAAQLRTLSNVSHLQRLVFERFLPEGIGLSTERRRSLRAAYDAAAPWQIDTIEDYIGGGYDGRQGPWLAISARRPDH